MESSLHSDRVQTLTNTTHINTFNNPWIKDANILTVNQGKLVCEN